MSALKIILIIIIGLILIVLALAWNYGLFSSVAVVDRIEGGFKVVGLEYTGAYSKSGEFMAETDKKLSASGISCSKGFGIYYDNPKMVEAEKCRSYLGGIIEEKDYGKISDLVSKGFKVDSITTAPSAVVEFPLKGSLSYMIGAMKAYPAIDKFMKEKLYQPAQAIEIYSVQEGKIIYVFQYSAPK